MSANPTLNGVAPITIAKHEDSVTVGTPEWDKLTNRRAELIQKKNREGLNEAERTEYERLQQLSLAAVAHAFPRPTFASEEKIPAGE
jgi:hypothetical protein